MRRRRRRGRNSGQYCSSAQCREDPPGQEPPTRTPHHPRRAATGAQESTWREEHHADSRCCDCQESSASAAFEWNAVALLPIRCDEVATVLLPSFEPRSLLLLLLLHVPRRAKENTRHTLLVILRVRVGNTTVVMVVEQMSLKTKKCYALIKSYCCLEYVFVFFEVVGL